MGKIQRNNKIIKRQRKNRNSQPLDEDDKDMGDEGEEFKNDTVDHIQQRG
jgi:hypothetical protein